MARAVVKPDGTIAVEAPETPTGVAARRGMRGIIVSHNRADGAVGYEVHVSTTEGFTPSQATLQGSGDSTIWTIPSLAPPDDPERMHYAKVIAYDAEGNRSAPSAEVSSPPGRLQALDVPDGLITTAMMQAGSVTDFVNVETDDPISTASLDYEPMPDMTITVPIEGPSIVWYSSLAPVAGEFDLANFNFWGAAVRMLLNDEQVGESIGWFSSTGLLVTVKRYDETLTYPFPVTVRLEWRRTGSVYDPERTVNATYRGLMAIVWKR